MSFSEKITGIVIVIIHYNRSDLLCAAVSRYYQYLHNNDVLWIVDNGSTNAHLSKVMNFIGGKINEVNIDFTHLEENKGGITAHRFICNEINRDRFPNATHMLLMSDDDFLLPSWRNEVNLYLKNKNDLISWGFNYFNWRDEKSVEAVVHRSNSINIYPAIYRYNAWIDGNVRIKKYGCQFFLYPFRHAKELVHGLFHKHLHACNFSKLIPSKRNRVKASRHSLCLQEHSSAVLLPIEAFKRAIDINKDIVTIPYGDVSFLLIYKEAGQVIYMDKLLGSIGRGENYGMTPNGIFMAQNHPSRLPIPGFPSHTKFLFVTYMEVVDADQNFDEYVKLKMCSFLLTRHVYDNLLNPVALARNIYRLQHAVSFSYSVGCFLWEVKLMSFLALLPFLPLKLSFILFRRLNIVHSNIVDVKSLYIFNTKIA